MNRLHKVITVVHLDQTWYDGGTKRMYHTTGTVVVAVKRRF